MVAPDGILKTKDKYTPLHTLNKATPTEHINTCLKVLANINAETGGKIINAEIKNIPTTLKANTTATEVNKISTIFKCLTQMPRV